MIFTDPSYGYEQLFRPQPETGNWVWSVNLDGTKLRAIDNSHTKSNGVAINSKSGKIHVTDTGYFTGGGNTHPAFSRTIYSYQFSEINQTINLSGKTALNIASKGIPDGIKVDRSGSIWSGTAAGEEVFEPTGIRSLIITVKDGISNLTFANHKQL